MNKKVKVYGKFVLDVLMFIIMSILLALYEGVIGAGKSMYNYYNECIVGAYNELISGFKKDKESLDE